MTALKKDGTPRKKPGPKPGGARKTAAATPAKRGPGRPPGSGAKRGPGRPPGSGTKAKPGPKPGARRGPGRRVSKEFNLYSIEENELSFLCSESGYSGQEAAETATAAGKIQDGVPVLPILATVLTEEVVAVIKTVPDPIFSAEPVKPTAKRRGRPPKAEAVESVAGGEVDQADDEPAAAPAASARKSARKAPAKPTPPPVPATGNPFAE